MAGVGVKGDALFITFIAVCDEIGCGLSAKSQGFIRVHFHSPFQ
jgi:hypothetical protein